MTDRCFRDEDLEQLALLQAGDPRLAHEERCGRCRARLAAFREFMDPSLPPEAEEMKAVAQLSEALKREIWDADVESPAEAQRGAGAATGWIARVRSALWIPVLRPLWIAAAAVLLVVAVREVGILSDETDVPSSLRGEPDAEVITAHSALLEGGGIRVTWERFAGADAYRLVVLDTGLIEILRVDAGTELTTILDASLIDALPGRDAGLLWRVVALRNGNQVARSALHSIDPRQGS